MPRATVTTNTQRHELKSCEGAYVVLKPMAYGVKLGRQQDAMKMVMKQQSGPRRRGQSVSSETEIQMLNKAATMIDFRNCIVDHNLTKADHNDLDIPLDLTNPADIEMLDPRVGEEISSLIDELNNWEAPTEDAPEGEVGNSSER